MHCVVVASGLGQITMGASSGAPSVIQYLPAGRHTISATVDGKPQTIAVEVDEASANVLQAALERRQADNVRPIVDFDHNDSGPAAAIPKRFFWDPAHGVMAELEWTDAGKTAVEGRNYSYFSPLFLADDKGRPIGLHPERPVGALVNNPAFRNIRRIAAASAQANTSTKPAMDHDFTPLIEAGILTADQAKSDKVVATIAAAFAKQKESIQTVEAAKATAEKDRDAAQAEIKAGREAQADGVIKRAVEAGKILEKDEEAKKFWRDLILEKGEAAVKQLEAKSPANPGIDKPIIEARAEHVPATQHTVEAARAAKIKNRAAELQKTLGLPYSTAWNRAKAEVPA